ncbi:MAG TPA: hypothetical protein VGB60_12665 [Brevundimonas sp.]|uniref:hypothetical protein n=1 Tax=Brevundimonas sp. TaxID=1871086 RepID=UPI002ED8DB53
MARIRPPKKSETLEVRLPYDAKAAFMARCRETGQTASEAVRLFIDSELAGRARARNRLRAWQTLAAAVAGLAIGAAAAPSLAQTSAGDEAAFETLDRDGNGMLTPAEFARR